MQAPFHVAPLIAALALLGGCSTAPSRSSGPPPAPERTFTVPVYANEPGRADATAKAGRGLGAVPEPAPVLVLRQPVPALGGLRPVGRPVFVRLHG